MMDQQKTILIADDDIDEHEFLTLAFNTFSEDFELIFTINGEDALDELERLSENKQLPVLIVLDVNMPLKDGFNTLKEIRSLEECMNIPVIMYSNSSGAALINSCKSAGSTDYIIKPYLFPEILTCVEKMLSYCGLKVH